VRSSTMYRCKAVKTIDTKSYLDTLCELTAKGETVSTIVSGSSMTPFLSGNRDYVFLKKPEKKLKTGDIVLFTRENGDYILHRIKKTKSNNCYLIGDRQTALEGPVSHKRIHCVVTAVKRKGKLISKKSPLWFFFSKIWIRLVFLRPAIFKVTQLFCKK